MPRWGSQGPSKPHRESFSMEIPAGPTMYTHEARCSRPLYDANRAGAWRVVVGRRAMIGHIGLDLWCQPPPFPGRCQSEACICPTSIRDHTSCCKRHGMGGRSSGLGYVQRPKACLPAPARASVGVVDSCGCVPESRLMRACCPASDAAGSHTGTPSVPMGWIRASRPRRSQRASARLYVVAVAGIG